MTKIINYTCVKNVKRDFIIAKKKRRFKITIRTRTRYVRLNLAKEFFFIHRLRNSFYRWYLKNKILHYYLGPALSWKHMVFIKLLHFMRFWTNAFSSIQNCDIFHGYVVSWRMSTQYFFSITINLVVINLWDE